MGRERLLSLLLAITVLLTGCRFSLPLSRSATPTPDFVLPVEASPTSPAPATLSVTATLLPGTVLTAPPVPTPPSSSAEQVLILAGTPEGPLTLDPALVRDVESAFVVQQLFRGLVRFDRALVPVPELAERIEIGPDGRSYTVRLRADARFHDGDPITAADVKYSLERACDPALADGDGRALPAWGFLRDLVGAQARMLGRRSDVPGIEVVDERTLRLHLVEPSPTFLLRLALPVASVVKRDAVERGPDWWRQPVGSGPFRLVRWTDEEIVLGRHPQYRPAPAYLREVRIRIGPAALSPLSQYERGQLDVAAVPVWAVDRLTAPESPYRDQLIAQPLLGGTYIFFNPGVPPLDDLVVRRALIQAFPRAKVAGVTLQGKVPLAQGLIPEGIPGGPWQATVLPYDPGEARRVLTGRSLRVEVASAGSDVAIMLGQVWRRELGVEVEVLQYDWPDYLTELDARRLPIFVFSWVADYPDPEAVIDALFAEESPNRPIDYRNAALQELLAAARRATDPQERHALLLAAQQQILDDVVVLPLTFDVEYLLVAPRVRDLPVTPLGILGLERVWIAPERAAR
jgi:ABC-type transport system substrate-binding protein